MVNIRIFEEVGFFTNVFFLFPQNHPKDRIPVSLVNPYNFDATFRTCTRLCCNDNGMIAVNHVQRAPVNGECTGNGARRVMVFTDEG